MKLGIIAILCLGSMVQPLLGHQQIQVRNSTDLDRIWQAYFANPDQAYVQQILEIITQDEKTMFLAYEYLNRHVNASFLSNLQKKKVEPNLDDLKKTIGILEKESPGFNDRLSIVTAAMWSLDNNVRNNPQVRADFVAVLKENQHLDYGKKINKTLGR